MLPSARNKARGFSRSLLSSTQQMNTVKFFPSQAERTMSGTLAPQEERSACPTDSADPGAKIVETVGAVVCVHHRPTATTWPLVKTPPNAMSGWSKTSEATRRMGQYLRCHPQNECPADEKPDSAVVRKVNNNETFFGKSLERFKDAAPAAGAV
jgi:hypothetical protein